MSTTLRELAVRQESGLTVTLAFKPGKKKTTVCVVTVDGFGLCQSFDAPAADAVTAFHHPFAYNADLLSPFDREVGDDEQPVHVSKLAPISIEEWAELEGYNGVGKIDPADDIQPPDGDDPRDDGPPVTA